MLAISQMFKGGWGGATSNKFKGFTDWVELGLVASSKGIGEGSRVRVTDKFSGGRVVGVGLGLLISSQGVG